MFRRNRREGIYFVAPAFVALFFLTIYPVFFGFYIGFLNIRGWNFSEASLAGFSNYARVLSDPIFLSSVRFTCLYTLLGLAIELPLGLVLAFLANEVAEAKPRAGRFFSMFVMLPVLFPIVATATMFRLMLNDLIGIIPHLANVVLHRQISLLSSFPTATLTLIAVDVWQWTPFFFLLAYAGLRGIPREYFEAMHIDGGGHWTTLRNIAIPLLKFVIVVSLALRAIWLFRSFDAPRILTGGGPGISTRTVTMQVYEYAFEEGFVGLGGAATIIVFLLVNLITFVYFRFLTGFTREEL